MIADIAIVASQSSLQRVFDEAPRMGRPLHAQVPIGDPEDDEGGIGYEEDEDDEDDEDDDTEDDEE